MNHNNSYPLSESDGGPLYYENGYSIVASDDLDYVNNWIDNTVEKEVVRGKKLRNEKMRYYHGQCDVMNIDFLKLAPYAAKNHRNYSKKYKDMTNSCSPRSVASYQRANSPRSCTPPANMWRQNSARTCQRKCPMRIAELAVPTKRQCIDTWRNKCDVLPRFMLERLRQQVMDQRPIVDIPEAIYCFKKRKSLAVNSGWNSSCKKMSFKEMRKASRIMEIRRLCAIFGQQIAKKLMPPLEIKLNSDLERISKVVADEMANIIRSRKRIYYDTVDYKPIHTEFSNKVAIWISNILEESSCKLLEEDLRDLEEEEGPVLDFIDDLVDDVVSICNPASELNEKYDSINSISESSTQEDKHYESVSETSESSGSNTRESVSNNSLEHESEDSLLVQNVTEIETQIVKETLSNPTEVLESAATIEDHLKNEIIDLIDKIAIDLTSEENITESVTIKKQIDEITDSITNLDITDSTNNTSLVEVQNTDHLDITDEINEEIKDGNMNQRSDSDMSEVNEMLSEESYEDKNKKVKFSNIDMVNQAERAIEKSDTRLLKENTDKELEQISWKSSSDRINSNLVFASPNKNLLSNADESWPADIASPVLKASESVSRSVTSLGKILEADEKLVMWPEDNTNIKDLEDVMAGQKTESDLETINKNKSDILQPNDEKSKNKFKTNDQNVDETLTIDYSTKISNETEQNIIKLESELKYKESYTGSTNAERLIILNQNQNANKAITSTGEKTEVNQMLANNVMPTEIAINRDATSEKNMSTVPKLVSKVFNENLVDTFLPKQMNTGKNTTFESSKKCKKLEKNIDNGGINAALELLEVVKEKNTMSKPKINYKVHLSTAPSWVTHGRGEPSDDAFYILSQKEYYKKKIYNIRKWGKDLEHGYESLQMWNDWIDNTCKSIRSLQKKRCLITSPYYTDNAKKWLKLKENIDKDVLFWIKFNQCTQEMQKSLRRQVHKKSKFASMEHCRCTSANLTTRTQNLYNCRKI